MSLTLDAPTAGVVLVGLEFMDKLMLAESSHFAEGGGAS